VNVGGPRGPYLGFGLGRLARKAFDTFRHSFESIWPQGSSQEPTSGSLVVKRQMAIYRKGLLELVQRLEKALEHLRKNPHDSSTFKNIQTLLKQDSLLHPYENEELLNLQHIAFKPLEEKIARISQPYMKATLQQLLAPLISEQASSKRSLHQLARPEISITMVMQISFLELSWTRLISFLVEMDLFPLPLPLPSHRLA
jgi:hypothetical protein